MSAIGGSLLSSSALERPVPAALRGLLGESSRDAARRRLQRWHAVVKQTLGPAAGARTVFDSLAVPLFRGLGYEVVADGSMTQLGPPASAAFVRAILVAGGRRLAAAVVTGWGHDAGAAWRDAVRQGIAHSVRWCFVLTGSALRVVDSERTYSRRFASFDVDTAIDDERAFEVVWGLLRADAMGYRSSDGSNLLERAVAISEAHRASVRNSLREGVDEALAKLEWAFAASIRARGRRPARAAGASAGAFDESLVVVYRILFLLFAEARGLVPRWHPVYRDGYTIESLRTPVELVARPRGLWETMQSISRLAHRGCRIGTLRVTPFNGRLFSPTESPLAESARLDDGAVRDALLSLTTRSGANGRERISYADLGVEQLGGVYERVLDLIPGNDSLDRKSPSVRLRTARAIRGSRRKTTGSFYTPRSLTEYLVRRTLAPLAGDAPPDTILSLRIVDPAMGSGAFLVAACRYLAAAYEAALVRTGDAGGDDLNETDRAGFRRTIAQRCLYGVDINPMAVQLGRLSLWLATLAADRPLTFLDHRLRVGNSLVGASRQDLARRPSGNRRRSNNWRAALPLFADADTADGLRFTIDAREAIAVEPGDTIAAVRAKERSLSRLTGPDAPLAKLKAACDAWCAYWFQAAGKRSAAPPFAPLLDSLLEKGVLPAHVAAPLLESLQQTADAGRFFHWQLEFPEAFAEDGAGFDAVIGNPPWEMLRNDDGGSSRAGAPAAALLDFARGSGIYSLQGAGHANLYQAFLDRMLQLLRHGGRLGVVLPWAFATDHGAAPLRRALLERTTIDTLLSFENRDGLFPIHRGLKFALLTTTAGGRSESVPCRLGLQDAATLDRLPDTGPAPDATIVPRSLLTRLSGEAATIPDLRSDLDVAIVSHVLCSTPALGSADGWHVEFGRELNATEDRRHFAPRSSAAGAQLPIVEGKHIAPFAVDLDAAVAAIDPEVARTLVDPARTFARSRLAYRDVASASNTLTLIAAIVPANVLTTHTLFCLRTRLDDDEQQFLCGMFNSYVANYLVRLQVGMHVTTATMARLPVPKPHTGSQFFLEIASLARALQAAPDDGASRATLQARAAHLYRLDASQFAHALTTFPLVTRQARDAALSAFCGIVAGW